MGLVLVLLPLIAFFSILLRPVFKLWLKVAKAVEWFNTQIILTLVYIIIFIPFSPLIRLFQKDLMRRKLLKEEETYIGFSPRGWMSFRKAMPLWISEKLHLSKIIKKELGWKGKVLFTEHHESHAASAFFPSPFEEAAIICFDGVGEWATTSWGGGW